MDPGQVNRDPLLIDNDDGQVCMDHSHDDMDHI